LALAKLPGELGVSPVVAGRDPKRALTIVGVTFAVLTVVAAFGYMYWGWHATLTRGFAWMDYETGGAESARTRAQAAHYVRLARASRGAGFAFGGVALGCAVFAAWRDRREWREWPWPSVVCLVPALLALVLALIGVGQFAARLIVLAVAGPSFFAAIFDMSRARAGSPSRPLSWTLLVASVLALLISVFLSWR
jgi:hypothetical protein